MTQISPDHSVSLKHDEARTNLSITLSNFNLRLKKVQFNAIFTILNKINKYHKFQNQFYETIKYKLFRPQNFASKIDYFRYAIKMVIKRNHYNKGFFNAFDIPNEQMIIFKERFMKLFPLYLNKLSLEEISDENIKKLKRIVEVIDIETLYKWSIQSIKIFYIQMKKEQNRKLKIGAVWRFLGYDLSEDQLLTNDEVDKIKEVLDNTLFHAFDPNQEESSIVSRLKIQDKNEVKLKIIFKLLDGSFEFLNNIGQELEYYDCFSLSYKNLSFLIKNSEKFTEYECMLKEIYLQMFSLMNSKKTKIIRLSYLNNKEILTDNPVWNSTNRLTRKSSIFSNFEENYVWKIIFKQYSQENDINSDLYFELVNIKFYI